MDILKVLFAEESAVTGDPDPFLPTFPAYKHGGPEFLLQIGEQKGMTIYLKRYPHLKFNIDTQRSHL